MVRFWERERERKRERKRERDSKRKDLCCKKPIKIWDVNVDNIVISKIVKTKN